MRDLVYGLAKINDTIQKKLAANDKSLETIQAKLDGFSTAIKNQLSFNKMLETQLAQLAAATPIVVDTGKIPVAATTWIAHNPIQTPWVPRCHTSTCCSPPHDASAQSLLLARHHSMVHRTQAGARPHVGDRHVASYTCTPRAKRYIKSIRRCQSLIIQR